MIFHYFKIGFECENTARELRRFERGIRPNLFLVECGKKIVNNLYETYKNINDSKIGRFSEDYFTYCKLIFDEINRCDTCSKKSTRDRNHTKLEMNLNQTNHVIDSILNGLKPPENHLPKAIKFFENISDKCLSYSYFEANTYK